MSAPTLITGVDITDHFNNIVKSFKKDAILVGIPETDSGREDDQHMTNAALLAMNQFGSPANNIPARPVMTIGIRNTKEATAEGFKKAVVDAFEKGIPGLEAQYERIGIINANSIKLAINQQDGIKAPSEATLKARKYITKTGFKGTKALVVTGQMRNAITSVVRSIWGS